MQIAQSKLPAMKIMFYEAFFLGLFIIFVLLVFQPFGTYNYHHENKILILSNYGAIVFCCHLILRKLSTEYWSQTWFRYHGLGYLVISFFATSFICFLYHQFFINGYFDLSNYPYFLSLFFSVYLFPALVIYGSGYVLNTASLKKPVHQTPSVLEIRVSGTKETYKLNTSEVLYFKSEGNYVRIVFGNSENLDFVLARSTLKFIEEQLPDSFLKTHRSYILNKSKIIRLVHRKNGSYVNVSNLKGSIPVSRKYKAEIKSALKDHTF